MSIMLFSWVRYTEVKIIYLAAFWVFSGRRTAWMLGRIPPWAIVTPDKNLFNSSSSRIQSRIIPRHLQLQATGDDSGFFVFSGSISYQLKNRSGEIFHDSGQVRRKQWIRPTGNWSPARDERVLFFPFTLPPLPRPDMMTIGI